MQTMLILCRCRNYPPRAQCPLETSERPWRRAGATPQGPREFSPRLANGGPSGPSSAQLPLPRGKVPLTGQLRLLFRRVHGRTHHSLVRQCLRHVPVGEPHDGGPETLVLGVSAAHAPRLAHLRRDTKARIGENTTRSLPPPPPRPPRPVAWLWTHLWFP